MGSALHSAGTLRRLIAFAIAPDGAPAEEQAAFKAYALSRSLDFGRLMTLFILASALAWWPIDYFWYPHDPAVQRAVSYWRAVVIAITLATLALTTFTALGRRRAYPVLVSCAWACVAALSFFLSDIGGIEQPFYHAALLIPVCLLPLLLDLRWRIVAALGVLVAWLGTYFGRHPEYLAHPYLPTSFASFGFSAVGTVIVGHVIYLLARSNFYQSRALALRNVDLTRDNESLSAELAERLDEVRRLSAHMDRAREAERRRIANELHDELGQLVTAMRLDVDRCHRNVDSDLAKVKDALARLSETVDSQASLVHRIVEELRPQVLDDLGLVAAADWLAGLLMEKSGVDITFRARPAEIHAPPEVASAIYRVLQEALNNALKHARARSIEVELVAAGDHVTLTVKDDGVGLALAERRGGGLGLIGMRERARAVGGTFELRSHGRGTTVFIELPMADEVRPLAMEASP